MKKLSNQEIEKELLALTSQLLAESGEPQKRQIKMDASLSRHLGIDSLGRAELFQRIEKTFGVSVPDKLLAEAETLDDIAKFLQSASPSISKPTRQEIITSHGEKANVNPSHVKTLLETLLLYGEKAPNKAHIYFQKEDGQQEIITYQQLLHASLRIANGLRLRGLKEGETVAIMQPTHPGFFYTFFGTLLAGGVPVPIYPPFRMHMLEAYAKTEARILGNAEVRVLVTFEEAEKLSHLLKAFVPSLKYITTVDELLHSDELTMPFKAQADNFAFIQYTSGSTSDPKGVLLNHSNLLANIRAYGKAIKVTPDDVAVSWLPLYHDMGLIGLWLGSLYFGVPLVLLTPFSFLNHPERWLWAIHYHRGTLSGAPNFGYELCVRKIEPALIEGLDLSSWRIAANGAEKVYPRTLEQFAKKFAPYGLKRSAILPVYGLAESTVALTIPPINRDFRLDHIDRKQFEEEKLAVTSTDDALTYVSCGVPLEDHQVRIVDDDNNPLAERHVGNLQFRGPSSMQGYYNNPKGTAAVMHDSWIDSGDLAYQAEGEIFITGRRKDLIIKAGRNLYPAELEEIVSAVPGVRQGCVAAFGDIDKDRGTEQLIIVAETREKDKTNRNKIKEDIHDAIATALDIVPDYVILVDPHAVPKTSSGKLQRAACKKMYMDGKLNKRQTAAWIQIARLGTQGLVRKIASIVTTVGKFIYTFYVTCILLITLLPIYLIVYFASQEFAAKACRLWARILQMAAFCPMTIVGRENLTKMAPVIFACNHASYVDSIVLVAALPVGTRFIGKKELLSAPLIGTFMRKLGHLPVDRMDFSKGIEDTKRIQQALKEHHSILIFPEGTFGYSSGLRPFRLGAFKMAAETNLAVCPIALQGTRQLLRDDEKLLRPSRITLTVCEPIMPKGSEWQDVTQLRNEVRAKIAQYCGEPSLDFIAAQTVAPKQPR